MEERSVTVVRQALGDRRVLAVSDIHGSLGLFQKLLQKLRYRPGEDALIILGDLVQKGPESLATLQYVMELAKTPHVVVLLGNNDEFALYGRDEHVYSHTAYWREKSLLGDMARAMGEALPESVEETAALREKAERAFPEEHAFLRELPHILETERYLFAHAGLQGKDLERQDLRFVLSAPRFHETVDHVFQKLLLVGHWPTANYRTDCLNNAPIYHQGCHVLSIDGGNTVKTIGQINGVVLGSETGEWSWDHVDGFPKLKAPCSQEYRPGKAITWPDNYVERVETGNGLSTYRAKRNGALFEIPDKMIYEDCGDGVFRTVDIASTRLGVEAGEELSLIEDCGDRLLVSKNGEAGWLLLHGGEG